MKIEKGRIFHHGDGDKELKLFEEQLKEKDKMNNESASKNHGIDDTPFGITNEGTDGIKQVPLETKEATLPKDKIGLEYVDGKRQRTQLEKEVDAEIIAKGKDAMKDFDKSQAIVVTPKKRRGRKPKVQEKAELKTYYCSTCRLTFDDKSVFKMGAGDQRCALFCPECQKNLGFFDQKVEEKLEQLLKYPNRK